ncbi:rhodanese-like domain-containing protein [Maribacter polysiphoniae]|uniref:Rhodanese-like domain-containing protein n=1 Tax=Maribacter polysiphoniae TaxID=429344 RepID=A0A316DT61_9FLAO|nr:rhodanese-like domain-containing protein [Maribacter polysiphoniae]MBD1262239.1 rhodanese-like domain-containing protein [Maribacter polysiphoniae]PWK21497.1 rhodanese-related sulfurtransferase [Maribacter polysiphoniae]
MSFLSLLFGGGALDPDKFEVLDKNAFKAAIRNKKVQLVDVRTAGEYRTGHIGKAINIDFFQGSDFKSSFEKLDKDKPVYLYCRSGSRSRKAARKVLDMGFEKVYDLQGGYMQW